MLAVVDSVQNRYSFIDKIENLDSTFLLSSVFVQNFSFVSRPIFVAIN